LTRTLSLVAMLACLAFAALAVSASAAAPSMSGASAERALERAQDALTPGPSTLSAGQDAGVEDATVALRDLAIALPSLRGADRRAAKDLLARPTDKNDRRYFGREAADSPVCDAQFCVHWTDRRKNAPVSNGFLDDILDAMVQSYAVENTALGWKQAKSDGRLGARHGLGTDGQVDVYVTNLGKRLYGYASTDRDQKGKIRRHAYLVLDNNYVGFPTPPTESMQVTVAHEYNHILQFNYDTFQDLWLFEATATWAEEQVYPDINDYVNYVPAFSRRPQVPMTGRSIKVYSEAIWNHWLSSRYGPGIVRRTWEVSPSQKHFAVSSYNRAIKDENGASSFGEDLGGFFADTAEFHSSSAFPDAAAYPDVKRSGKVTAAKEKVKLDNTSFRLYRVEPTAAGSTTLEVRAEKGTRSTIALVGRHGGEPGVIDRDVLYLPRGGSGTVTLADPASFSRITAMVANVDGRSGRRDRKGKRVYKSDGSSYRLSLGG
jgi:Family of unknown function (DUF6055)